MKGYLVVELEDNEVVDIAPFSDLDQAKKEADRIKDDQAEDIAEVVEKDEEPADLDVIVWSLHQHKAVYTPTWVD